jgi:hypothetical protein
MSVHPPHPAPSPTALPPPSASCSRTPPPPLLLLSQSVWNGLLYPWTLILSLHSLELHLLSPGPLPPTWPPPPCPPVPPPQCSQCSQSEFLFFFLSFFFFLWWAGILNSGLHACKVGFLLLKLHPSPVHFADYFGDGGLTNYLPWLAWNQDLPDLSLPSTYDYRWATSTQLKNVMLIKTLYYL